MNDMDASIGNYVKESRLHLKNGDLKSARTCILKACECALLLAKRSLGKVQDEYLAKYKTLKALLADIDKKIADAIEAPAVPDVKDGEKADTLTPSVSGGVQAPIPTPKATDGAKDNGGQFIGSLSPRYLEDYIGQPGAVMAVKDLISAALLRGAALPHIILYGSHGLGKTTFSKIIANEMHANFIEVNVNSISAGDLIDILKQLKANDILFIDEIHTLPTKVAESVLYSAMQDGRITYVDGSGKASKTVTLDLPPFTLIGATTEIGKIAKPFIQRAIQVRLEEYTDEVLSKIITASFYKLGMSISADVSLKIAKRCRNNPRIANNMVKRISDKSLVRYASANNIRDNGFFSNVENIRSAGITVEQTVVDAFFDESGIDAYGLESGDRELLRVIITRYGGGPVGIDTLARVLNESNNVIMQKYEAYLIKKGMLKIEREGRVVMPDGYRALGMPVPESIMELERQESSAQPEAPTVKYERKTVLAEPIPDALKCAKIEELIVYPENAVITDTPLDTLFPAVEKPFEDIANHTSELEIDFGTHKRLLICDSSLECRFATVLARVGYLGDIKAQSLAIPYVSSQLADRNYYPDFMIRDYKGRIAIIEMKNFDAACYHLNIDKYEQLKAYCLSHGYGYAEVMKAYNADEYVSLEAFKNKPQNKQLEAFIINKIEENSEFTTKDFNEYKEKFGFVEKTEIYTLLLNNRRLRSVERGGTDIKIVLG